MKTPSDFIGIDVSSQWLDICLQDGSVKRIDNSITAITEWVTSLPRTSAVAMEATGRYHSLLASAAFHHRHSVYVLNPRAVYYYAAGIGRRQKSDKADAAVIQRYLCNEHDKLKPWKPATAQQFPQKEKKQRICLNYLFTFLDTNKKLRKKSDL